MIQVLSAAQLRVQATPLGVELFGFMSDLKVGEGGVYELPGKVQGYGRSTVKARIGEVAGVLGQEVRFRRASEDQVIFQRTA